jgi:hypothetical protein
MSKLYCSRISHNPYKEDMTTEITERVFQIDGYQIADRLLEGLIFDIHFDDNGVTDVVITNEHSRKYFESNFNSKKFYNLAKEYAQSILDEGDEVDVPKYIKDKYYKNGVNVSYITNK